MRTFPLAYLSTTCYCQARIYVRWVNHHPLRRPVLSQCCPILLDHWSKGDCRTFHLVVLDGHPLFTSVSPRV